MTKETWPEWMEPPRLDRFLKAQAGGVYEIALAEIREGRKRSHWMWYIFPQIEGLGRTPKAQYYAIQDRQEAERYWAEPLLRQRLVEITEALLPLEGEAWEIMGYPDDLKLRSSMTLFRIVTGEPLFQAVLDKFYGGEPDEYTVRKLGR